MTTALATMSERSNGARTSTPPASRATAVKGLPFSTVYGDVMQRADAMLPGPFS